MRIGWISSPEAGEPLTHASLSLRLGGLSAVPALRVLHALPLPPRLRRALARCAGRGRSRWRSWASPSGASAREVSGTLPGFLTTTVRRRGDSNPRRLRATVFKTVAFDHSATPPE